MPRKKEQKLYTITEAAQLIGVRPVTLRTAAANGKLRATRIGGFWVVTEAALNEWKATASHKSGRPRKSS